MTNKERPNKLGIFQPKAEKAGWGGAGGVGGRGSHVKIFKNQLNRYTSGMEHIGLSSP